MTRHLTIIGGSLTGNKGAASMVLAVVDRVRAETPDATFSVLSPLASDDADAARQLEVELVPFGPVEILSAVLGAVLARVTGGRVAVPRAVRALRRADVVADVSGIAFVDGRGLVTLVYNILLVLPGLLLGRPVVKIAQALGPFGTLPTRLAARLVLPRLAGLLARGARTQAHLDEAGLPSDGVAADVAFLMETSITDEAWADEIVGRGPVACVAPSQVVLDQAQPLGVDYLGHVVAIVDALTEHRDVLLLAHSARPGKQASRLNDIPLCEEVRARSARPDRCRVAPVDATPRQLRALIGRSDLLVTSRFHAMVSGLAKAVPVLVVGWSHKYQEVLVDFGVPELALDFRSVDQETVAGHAVDVLDGRGELADAIRSALPEVLRSAERNIVLLHEVEVLHGTTTLPPAHERRAP